MTMISLCSTKETPKVSEVKVEQIAQTFAERLNKKSHEDEIDLCCNF